MMSDLSTNDGSSLSNVIFPIHANSRPKLQPVRVKALFNVCESDDDESEDKIQDSDSDSDDPQSLPEDDVAEDILNKSFEQQNNPKIAIIIDDNESNQQSSAACNVSRLGVSLEPGEPSVLQQETGVENKCDANIENDGQMPKHQVDEQLHTNDLCTKNQQNTCKIPSNELEPMPFKPKSLVHEEQVKHESNLCNSKSHVSDSRSQLNTINCLSLQTPLKQAAASSIRPNLFLPHKNIQTPQNKMQADLSKNHGLTPATILSHWSQNCTRQTPMEKKNANMKNFLETPKNSAYFTPNIGKHETPRFFSTEKKGVRRPLADAPSFMHNDASNVRILQGTVLSKLEEVTPMSQNKLCVNKDSNNRNSNAKRALTASENAVQFESDMNDHLKENRHLNVIDARENKDIFRQNKVSDIKPSIGSNPNLELKNNLSQTNEKDEKAVTKPTSNISQNQYPTTSNNQQQNAEQLVDKISSVQFSMPSNVPKSQHNRTLFVKGREYLILGTLGQGMSGEVLRVQDLSSSELCAIKCVNLNRMDKDSAQGCLEEISMLHKLQAPCIVRMFDYEIKYPMVYVVMEMGDTDLSRFLKSISQEKQLPLTMILYYWTEMLTAVKHIHDNGVIHSDLKPANFLLVRGRLKLIDFGIASSMNAEMTSVVKNCPIGTLNYISPEALMDIGGNSDSPTKNVQYKITFKSDVWSLGCILYSLVYGHTPFHHIRSQWAKVNAITNPKPSISFPTTLPSCDNDNKPVPTPPVLIDVMRKCLQHDPKARPTVSQLLQIQYIPSKQERIFTAPKIPANILVKIKHSLDESEWRQLIQVLENRPYT